MKYKLKSRLLAALACFGLVVNCQYSANAQEDFGFIRPATPVDSSPQSEIINPQAPPIVQSGAGNGGAFPPISLPPIVGPTPSGNEAENTPLPFAPAQIGTVSAADYQPSETDQGFARPVGYQQDQWQADQRLDQGPPNLTSPNRLPPIVGGSRGTIPPIVSDQAAGLAEIEVASVPEVVSVPSVPGQQTPEPSVDPSLRPELAIQTDPPVEPVLVERNGPLPVAELPPMSMEAADLVPVTEEEAPAPTTPVRYDSNAVSSAGVPLYAGATPELRVRETQPTPMAGVEVLSVNVPPNVNQDAPATPGQLPTSSPAGQYTPAPQQAMPVSPVPSASTQVAPSAMGSVQGMIQPAEPQMGQSYFRDSTAPGPVASPGCASCGSMTGGCPDCGVAGSTVAGCQGCGNNGCYNPSVLSARFNSSGAMSYARRYAIFDALYFDRDDGTISNSNFGALTNFDYNAGLRVTLGRRSDSTRGRELSYMGTMPIEQTQEVFSPTGLIQSRFIPVDGFTTLQTSGFENAVQQSQAKETFFHSIEFNRVRWGWDVMKTYFGLRYIMVDDSYTMYSQNLGGEQGFFQLETKNHLIGPHIGAELFYDVGRRLSASLVSKFGVYANINETDTVLDNNGIRFLDIEDNNSTIATTYEFGLNAHLRLSRRARFRLGYNFIWMGEVASVSDNFNRFISPSTGTNSGDSDHMFFHGVAFGFELYR